MASSGFRPPQFSEDVAWLPVWLQPCRISPFDESTKDSQDPRQQTCKDLVFVQEDTHEARDVDLCPREDALYKSCHLFLSGGDNTPTGTMPSSENMPHFHLHLSSDGISQHTPGSILDIIKTESILSKEMLNVASAIPENSGSQVRNVNMLLSTSKPRDSQNSRIQSLGKSNRNNRRKKQEKSNSRRLKTANFEDAIELSIAASEALVISELVKNSAALESLSANSVLEVALRVKEARNGNLLLDGLDDASTCSSKGVDETELLLDLDEDFMEDAFEDVGISVKWVSSSCNNQCGFNLATKDACSPSRIFSHVLDTPASGKQDACDSDVQYRGFRVQEGVKFDIADANLFYTQASIDSPWVQESGKAVAENEITDVDTDKFRSRWLGGWTIKDAEVFACLDQSSRKGPGKFFIGETSFLSESADVAPDENSFVQNLETCISLMPGMPSEYLCDRTDEEIVPSQDIVRSSSLSLADPICSLVPCSVSCDNVNDTLYPDQKYREEETDECLNPISDLGTDNLPRTLASTVQSANTENNTLPKIHSKISGATSRRELNSLKAYSMLVPAQNFISKSKNIHGNESLSVAGALGFLSPEKGDNYLRSSSNEATRLLCLDPASKCSAGEGCEISATGKHIPELMVKKTTSKETESSRDELQVNQKEDRWSPIILNNGSRRRHRASKIVESYITGEGNLERFLVPELMKNTNLVCCEDQSKTKLLPQLPSSPLPHPHDDQGPPPKKKVRFSEDKIKFQHNKSRPGSITRFGKRLENSNSQLNFRARKVNSLKNCRIKYRSRMIFQGIEFLLTGFSSQKERELEALIREHGGIVLSHIPLPSLDIRGNRRSRRNQKQKLLPVLLAPKKLETTKFLYGCAVNAFLLKDNWLTDSIVAGSMLNPDKRYMILQNQTNAKVRRIGRSVCCDNMSYIFDRVGVMLHGRHSFCTKLANIVKHGGGQVFRTLQWLIQSLQNGKNSVGVIVAEDVSRASRHLRHCALEQKLPMMPATWVIDSLHLGRLLPFVEDGPSYLNSTVEVPDCSTAVESSEET
ncbi:PREDICTED: uncharacterized protein LOC104607858 isoform X2 [Nelumbo nucifera]|uniref:Uncharacterized protein LOC104607858 isoform X2 n=1 Tax=Nelumbo nucifera TaxID=4432 RepID=A0A1U8QAG2_NELNU|nr:PREDICTED: uncharacterized protein LOC104607858 isoform X2 [Nelumbo nucifera]